MKAKELKLILNAVDDNAEVLIAKTDGGKEPSYTFYHCKKGIPQPLAEEYLPPGWIGMMSKEFQNQQLNPELEKIIHDAIMFPID